MRTQTFDFGETIFYEVIIRALYILSIFVIQGDPPDFFYVVKKGMAAAMKTCTILRQYKTAEFFGELSLIKGAPKGAELIALTDLEVFFSYYSHTVITHLSNLLHIYSLNLGQTPLAYHISSRNVYHSRS